MESLLVNEEKYSGLEKERPKTWVRPTYIVEPILENLEKLWRKLKKIEEEFLDTRRPELLVDFKPDREIEQVKLEKPIADLHYLADIPECIKNAANDQEKNHYKQIEENIREDAKLFNAQADVQIVEKKDGTQSLAVIGVDPKLFRAFHELRDRERTAQKEITLLKEEIDLSQARNIVVPLARKSAAVDTYIRNR